MMLESLSSQLDQWVISEAGAGWPGVAILRLLTAAFLGGLVGLERERRGHEAGFRTYMLVCVGCALAMLVSIHFARIDWAGSAAEAWIRLDPARIAYGVMGGIGFLGAGVIIQNRGMVRGLTTAAGIWCIAALGLSVGVGMYLVAGAAVVIIGLSLWILDAIERVIPERQTAWVGLSVVWAVDAPTVLRRRFGDVGLKIQRLNVKGGLEPGQSVRVNALVRSSRQDLIERLQRVRCDDLQVKLERVDHAPH